MRGTGAPRTNLFWELAGLIARIPGLGQRAPLRRAADAFTEQIGPLDVEQSGMLQEDLYAVLRRCDDYPNGLRFYLDTLGSNRTNTLAWAEVERLYRRLCPESLLTPAERDELSTLLGARRSDPPLERVALRFLPCLPSAAPGGSPRRDTTAELLDALEDAVVLPDEAHPLLSFVEAVAVHQPTPLEAELRAWNEKVAHRIGGEPRLLARVRALESARLGRPFEPGRLLVEIVAHPAVPDEYHVRGSLLAPGEGPQALLADCRVTSRPALEETVAQLHQRVLDRLGELSAGLTVEFLLPRPLLWLDVDQFAVRPAGSVARPIGADHTVLVRSRDRFSNRHWWPALHRRLAWLESHPNGAFDTPAVRFVPAGRPPEPYDLLRQLRDEETPFCFVLLEPPPYEGDLATDPVYVLLEVGIPAIVALRGGGRRADARPELGKVLAGRLAALPERVRHLRGGAPACNGAPSVTLDLHRHVTLVWDSRDGLEGAEAALGHPRTGGGHP
ncbi:VMAP-C domain-containing protein [Streptomyces sp. HUAS TT20]|uniref:VMAP-C domain-containing protein n=1 Tax=Streptomyces sp. HUAS TT20 TaxID=3447509 RepID=UPI0021D84AF5|nr:hypothetical protein [Streptomyces sp. HUAS 15-9]UXY31371.1 hypothetical protein N8I87_35740 [Streptomyces sp. HUAS 15-9]